MAIDYLRLTDKSYISFLHPRLLSADNFVFTIHIERRITKWHCSTAGIYLLKVIIGNTVTMFEICSKLALKTSEQGHLRRSGVSLLTLPRFHIQSFPHRKEASHQDNGPSYLHLTIFFLIHTLSSSAGK